MRKHNLSLWSRGPFFTFSLSFFFIFWREVKEKKEDFFFLETGGGGGGGSLVLAIVMEVGPKLQSAAAWKRRRTGK